MRTSLDKSRNKMSRWSSNSGGWRSTLLTRNSCLLTKAIWLAKALIFSEVTSKAAVVSLSIDAICPLSWRKPVATASVWRRKLPRATTEAGAVAKSRAEAKNAPNDDDKPTF